jgi:hypothetical protein
LEKRPIVLLLLALLLHGVDGVKGIIVKVIIVI